MKTALLIIIFLGVSAASDEAYSCNEKHAVIKTIRETTGGGGEWWNPWDIGYDSTYSSAEILDSSILVNIYCSGDGSLQAPITCDKKGAPVYEYNDSDDFFINEQINLFNYVKTQLDKGIYVGEYTMPEKVNDEDKISYNGYVIWKGAPDKMRIEMEVYRCK